MRASLAKFVSCLIVFEVLLPTTLTKAQPRAETDNDPDDLASFMRDLHGSIPRGGDIDLQHVLMSIPEFGNVKGLRTEGVDFFGNLPYAAPPVGNLRFAPPEPPAPWSPATLDATQYGADCWQVVDPQHNPIGHHTMSEDCLTLNIFTPAGQIKSRSKKLPVMVWLHGGAFQQGGANRPEYNGKALVERDMIIVTLNYRLGALGFLVCSADGLYGNYGLMDQRAALDWISTNIQYFGGDPSQITLFGESAGGVMIALHLMMQGAGKLFQRVIIQSIPMGYTFRTLTVADFIGEALKKNVDCRDLGCLRSERVEDLIKAQSSLMGVPRSVGDFFTWSPTLTQQTQVSIGVQGAVSSFRSSQYLFRDRPITSQKWAAVNVSQPLKNLDKIPGNIPVILGSNKHEGEIFVYNVFPAPMPKPVYWMFVGALFRDSASRILKHYSAYVEQVEAEAEELAQKQMEEEENKQFYLEHREQLENEYQLLLAMNATRRAQKRRQEGVEALVETWSRGGAGFFNLSRAKKFFAREQLDAQLLAKRATERQQQQIERRKAREKARALKNAAKVVVDYRPVMSRIIDDYLFRCPTWHYAHRLSGLRQNTRYKNNVFVYRFSQPTHLKGYKECWGKSCHTSELPFVFQAMDTIRANYSTVGPAGQQEAPEAPEYPYTDILAAYRGALEAFEANSWGEDVGKEEGHNGNYTRAFQRIVSHFFGDYFKEDADEEIATDMAERWAAFAQTGNPNYEGSKVEWFPWRIHQADSDTEVEEGGENDMRWVFSTEDFDDDEEEKNLRIIWSDNKEERAQRRRALATLGYEVIDEDIYRTELRRAQQKPKDDEVDKAFLSSRFLFRASLKLENDGLSKVGAKELLRLSREMGVLGVGLVGDDRSRAWEGDFFPELLELQWPPEGHLVERDCTCDLWDRIRYRY